MSESIYNLVPEPYVEPEKTQIYRSKYDPSAPLTGSSFGLHGTTATVGGGITEIKKSHVLSSTFGPTSKTVNSPKNFLRKSSQGNTGTLKDPRKFNYGGGKAKPSVPRREEKPIMGLRTSKNFITANAVEAILSVPQMPRNDEVDYMSKSDFGAVPEYLDKVKEEIRRENDMIDEYVAKQLEGGYEINEEQFAQMDEDERRYLIDKLKTKWDAVNAQYQKTSHRVKFESKGDIQRKVGQEGALKQLEDDIMTLQRAGPVMIQD